MYLIKNYVVMSLFLTRFFEGTSYQLKDSDIIIYINQLKEEFALKTVRNHLICIRRFLSFIDHPIAEHIRLPKIPKRRKTIVKVNHIRELLENVEGLRDKFKLRLKAAILLSATSGLRAEELYKLKLNDIDLENRTVYVKAEIAKDFEDRVTFFSLEAQRALQEYINIVNTSHIFPKKSVNYHLQKLNSPLRLKHMRKFFSQQSDRLGMPTAAKKIWATACEGMWIYHTMIFRTKRS